MFSILCYPVFSRLKICVTPENLCFPSYIAAFRCFSRYSSVKSDFLMLLFSAARWRSLSCFRPPLSSRPVLWRHLVEFSRNSSPRGPRLVGLNSYLFSFSGLSFSTSLFIATFHHRRSLRRLSLLRDIPRQHPPLLHEVSVKVDRTAVAALLAAGGRIVILQSLTGQASGVVQPSQSVIVLSLLLV